MRLSHFQLIAALVATATLPATALAADHQHMADIPQIMITGYAHEWRVPDEATTTAVFTGNGTTADAAINDLLPSTNKATALIKQAGIADDDTWTTGPEIEALYKHFYDAQGHEIMERREPNGFRATFRLNFKTKDIAGLGKLIPTLTEAKATIEGVSFAISDYRQLQQSLQELAVTDAVARAKRQIAAAGAKPGRILSIGERPQAEQPVYRMTAMPAPMAKGPQQANMSFALRPGKQDISVEQPVVVEILPQ
jgi:uncharacterized protein YggE